MTSSVPGIADLFSGGLGYHANQGGGGGGGGYVSASSSASSGPVGFSPSFGSFGGINTGTQGLDVTTIAIVAGLVLLVMLLRK